MLVSAKMRFLIIILFVVLFVMCGVILYANYASMKKLSSNIQPCPAGAMCFQLCCSELNSDGFCEPQNFQWDSPYSSYFVTRNISFHGFKKLVCRNKRVVKIQEPVTIKENGTLYYDTASALPLSLDKYCVYTTEIVLTCDFDTSRTNVGNTNTIDAKKAAIFNRHLVKIVLIVSTVCYFLSAGCYLFFLKVTDIHRRCFVAYSVTMGFSFLFLVLLQQLVQAKCVILGFFFFYFIECGFLWLMFLCLDLALQLRYFDQELPESRWYVHRWWIYVAFNVLPAFFLIISIIPDGIPDIPNTFIIDFGDDLGQTCFFNGTQNYFFFLPIGLMMIISLVALMASVYFIRVNNTKHSNHFKWLDERGSYKYIFRSCLLMWIFAAVWMIESAVRLKMPAVQYFALFVIEASLGIFAFLTFVMNRYIRKEMLKRLRVVLVKKNQTDILLSQLKSDEENQDKTASNSK